MKTRLLLSAALILCVVAAPAFAAKTYLNVKASYQAVFQSNLNDESEFVIPRARVGAYGSFFPNMYFEVVVEGKKTKDGEGAQLKKGFISWEFINGLFLEFGAVQVAFTRPISGTGFSFINYDITWSLDPYQYGLQLKLQLLGDMLTIYGSACNGEGLQETNIGNGLLYAARLEFNALGKKDLTDGFTKDVGGMSLTVSAGIAMDNKAETYDYGVTYSYYGSTHLVFDAMFKMAGISVFGQYNYNEYGRKEDRTYWGGPDNNLKKSYGFTLQGGFNLKSIINMDIEPMGRFEWWRDVIEEGYGPQATDMTRFALAVNWYLRGHFLKFTLEYQRVLSDEHVWFIKEPAKDYAGLRITHKFTTGLGN